MLRRTPATQTAPRCFASPTASKHHSVAAATFQMLVIGLVHIHLDYTVVRCWLWSSNLSTASSPVGVKYDGTIDLSSGTSRPCHRRSRQLPLVASSRVHQVQGGCVDV